MFHNNNNYSNNVKSLVIDEHVTWINWHIVTGSNFILTLPHLTLTLNKWCAWGECY